MTSPTVGDGYGQPTPTNNDATGRTVAWSRCPTYPFRPSSTLRSEPRPETVATQVAALYRRLVGTETRKHPQPARMVGDQPAIRS